jgi:hypothetical protein
VNRISCNSARDEERLGALAMQFRGTKSKATRRSIAKDYGQIVERLIRSGNWRDMPAPEDQLPDEFMPSSFFEYWLRR